MLWVMQLVDTERSYIQDSYLSQSDESVLSLIREEGLTGFTFDGLKRRLGIHPETLSRAMDRLEEQGLVEKRADGYKATPKAKASVTALPLSTNESSVPLLQTLLPDDMPLKQVVSELSGKWFGTLRWLGRAEGGEGIVLKWITEDGGIQVDAVFLDNSLSVEAKLLSEKNFNSALIAAYQLIAHISRLYSKSGGVKLVNYLSYFDSIPVLRWM
jgi:DNA-binding transcriptional ArsR family regulator